MQSEYYWIYPSVMIHGKRTLKVYIYWLLNSLHQGFQNILSAKPLDVFL